MKKQYLFCCMCVWLLLLPATGALAADLQFDCALPACYDAVQWEQPQEVQIQKAHEEQSIVKMPPFFLKDNIIYVPARPIADLLGVPVTYHEDLQYVELNFHDCCVYALLDLPEFVILSDAGAKQVYEKSFIVNRMLYLPLRQIVSLAGGTLTFDETQARACVTYAYQQQNWKKQYTEDQKNFMEAIYRYETLLDKKGHALPGRDALQFVQTGWREGPYTNYTMRIKDQDGEYVVEQKRGWRTPIRFRVDKTFLEVLEDGTLARINPIRYAGSHPYLSWGETVFDRTGKFLPMALRAEPAENGCTYYYVSAVQGCACDYQYLVDAENRLIEIQEHECSDKVNHHYNYDKFLSIAV